MGVYIDLQAFKTNNNKLLKQLKVEQISGLIVGLVELVRTHTFIGRLLERSRTHVE